HVGSRKPVLIHEVTDDVGCTRRPAGPFAFLIVSDEPRLCFQPPLGSRIIRPIKRSTRASARANSASLSMRTRVASIKMFSDPQAGLVIVFCSRDPNVRGAYISFRQDLLFRLFPLGQ